MSNRLFQSVIHQMKGTIDRTIGVIDESSSIIACSELGKVGENDLNITKDILITPATFIINGSTYKSFGNRPQPEYAVFVEGTDEVAQKYAVILSISLDNIRQYHDEKYDRNNFVKNIMLDNVLPGDLYLKARELKFNASSNRVCLLIRMISKSDLSAYDVVGSLFQDRFKDFIINVNLSDIVVVKEVNSEITMEDLEKLSRSIIDTLTGEFRLRCIVGIGSIVSDIKEIAKSYKEAQVSIEVSKVFDKNKTIISYEKLGIARLVYQLPTTLCDMFLKEVFKNGSIELLDQETLFTIQKFFENNLNVSETSRKLFVHRNTLVYRIEKIKKLTGLDLREFEDAIVFKIALMVKKYLLSSPIKY